MSVSRHQRCVVLGLKILTHVGVVGAGDSRGRAARAPDDGDRGAVYAHKGVDVLHDDAETGEDRGDAGVAGL